MKLLSYDEFVKEMDKLMVSYTKIHQELCGECTSTDLCEEYKRMVKL